MLGASSVFVHLSEWTGCADRVRRRIAAHEKGGVAPAFSCAFRPKPGRVDQKPTPAESFAAGTAPLVAATDVGSWVVPSTQ